jgi:hypothetical protein
MKRDGTAKRKQNVPGLQDYRRTGEAPIILREQQMESDLEELWMDGPSIVNEEEPRIKRLGIL